MSNKILNTLLYVTAVIAIAVIVVFFIKLSNVEPDGKDGKAGTDLVDAEKLEGLSALTGKQGTTPGLKQDDGKDTPSVTDTDVPDATGYEVSPTPTDTEDNPSGPVTPTDAPTEAPTTPTPELTKEPDDKDSIVTVDVSRIDPTKPIVALSFDDGPSVNTASIIETLNEYGVHATFFMVGDNVKMYPERVKMVYDAGCEVGKP